MPGECRYCLTRHGDHEPHQLAGVEDRLRRRIIELEDRLAAFPSVSALMSELARA